MLRLGLAVAVTLLTMACNPMQKAASTGPTPTPLATLATRYAQLMEPSNAASTALAKALAAPDASMTSTRAAFTSYRSALTTLGASIPQLQADVPASVREDVQRLRDGVTTELGDVDAILSATTDAAWQAAITRWYSEVESFAGAAQLVRADLGRPTMTSAPTPSS